MAKDIMNTQECMISITEWLQTKTIRKLQLHTHKAQAKSKCTFRAHDKGLACLGVDKYSGKKWETIVKWFAGNSSFSEGAVYGQGQKGHFHCVKILWKWHQRNGLDETKTWALDSPHLELWLKSYKVFSARDLSVMKIFSNRAWTEKQKAY